ncbi:MAG: LOG family protein [Candidatus Omnitrophica bacterium]|nr:LOG family protein [Candidatus Omnitrophota bacterium]
MPSGKVITIFGGRQIEENMLDYQKARQLGGMLAREGFVICNGGYGGVMEASARGAHEEGGKTIGITAEEFPGQVNRWIQEERKVKTWRERLFKLIDTADGYVVFDGSTGTLTELFAVWEMTNKKMLDKPIILYGVFLKELLEKLRQEKIIIMNKQIKTANTPEEILQYLISSS